MTRGERKVSFRQRKTRPNILVGKRLIFFWPREWHRCSLRNGIYYVWFVYLLERLRYFHFTPSSPLFFPFSFFSFSFLLPLVPLLVMIPDATPTRKRLKALSACSECRRKKTKCNSEKPCRSCEKANVPCEYPTPLAGSSEDKRSSTSSSSKAAVEAIEDRLRSIEDMLNTLLKGGQGVADVDKDALIQFLQKETSSLRPNLMKTYPQHAATWDSNQVTTLMDRPSPVQANVDYDMEGNGSAQQPPRLPSISELDKGCSDSQTDASTRSHMSRPLSYEAPIPDSATGDRFQLPHLSVQEYLYGIYFDLVHPLCPVLDRYQFSQTTLALPTTLDETNIDMCLDFMQTYAVLSCAAEVAPSSVLVPTVGTSEMPGSQMDPITAGGYFFECTTRLLERHESVAHPTVVATLCLLVLRYGRGDTRQTDKTCSYVTRLNDMAMHLSLHMTPTENSSTSFRQRCLFWSVFTHDRMANLLYGRAMSIEEENIFVDLSDASAEDSPPDMQLFVEYVKLTRMLGRIMRHSHNPWQLSNIDRALHHWLRALPKSLLLSSNDISQVPIPVRTLHLLFHINVLALHKPHHVLEARKPSPATSLSASTSFGALNLSDAVASPPTRTPSPPSAGLGNIPISTIQAILTIGDSFTDPRQRHLMNTNKLLHHALVWLAKSQLDKLQQHENGIRTVDGDQWLIKCLDILKLVSFRPDSELARSVWEIEKQCHTLRQKVATMRPEGKRSYESIDSSVDHDQPPTPQRAHSPDDRKNIATTAANITSATPQLLVPQRIPPTATFSTVIKNALNNEEPKTFDFVPLIPRNGELWENRQSISKFIHYTADSNHKTSEDDLLHGQYPRGSPQPRSIFQTTSPEHTLKSVTSMPSLHESNRYSRNVRSYSRQPNSASTQLWELAAAAAAAAER
jgi:Fungal Zn(2)-Cys(6) binuclear cluster domain/Fungal specific transcription factor domain